MKISPNFTPLVVVSWIMIIYMLATSNLAWYLWLFIAICILERFYIAFAMWVQAQAIKSMAQDIIKQFQQSGGPHI